MLNESECSISKTSRGTATADDTGTSTDFQNDDYCSLDGSEEYFRSKSKPSVRSVTSQVGKGSHEMPEFYKSRASTTEFCRICHDLDTAEPFISPCRCKGSLSAVHRSCLERWLAESDSSRCELCGFVYLLQRLPKYRLLPSVAAWLRSRETMRDRRNLLVDLIALILISPIVCITTLMALRLMEAVVTPDAVRYLEGLGQNGGVLTLIPEGLLVLDGRTPSYSDMLTNLGRVSVVAFVITIDLAYVSWFTIKLQYHVSTWYYWYRRNCKVTLIGYPAQSHEVTEDSPQPLDQTGPSTERSQTANES